MPEACSDAPQAATHRFEVDVTPDEADLVAAHLWAAGALGVWEQPTRLVAWFADRGAPVPEDLDRAGTWSVEPDRDWQGEWKATIEPVRAGDITVVPSWLSDEHRAAPGELVIVLDPGRAFGSGHHATTTMCLELLDELDLDGAVVADVGCGTGILAIAAALRGSSVVAVDIDPAAIEVTRENARRNGVTIDVRAGSVDALPGRADVVTANLVTDVIVAAAAELVAACRDVLVVSGIATQRATTAKMALEAAGATVDTARERDGWVALRAHVAPDAPGIDRARGGAA